MDTNTDALCAAWLDAKRAENKARDQRIAIEAQIAEAFDVPGEGNKTHQTDNYKVTVSQPIYRKIDVDAWDRVKGKFDPALWPIKTKIEADATGCKYLTNNEPEIWAAMSEAFVTSPGKVGIKVEAK